MLKHSVYIGAFVHILMYVKISCIVCHQIERILFGFFNFFYICIKSKTYFMQ